MTIIAMTGADAETVTMIGTMMMTTGVIATATPIGATAFRFRFRFNS